MMNANEITWNTDNLSLHRVERYFGMGVASDGREFIAHVMRGGRSAAVSHCESRAAGAWDANARESYAMWRSLARLIEAGEVK